MILKRYLSIVALYYVLLWIATLRGRNNVQMVCNDDLLEVGEHLSRQICSN